MGLSTGILLNYQDSGCSAVYSIYSAKLQTVRFILRLRCSQNNNVGQGGTAMQWSPERVEILTRLWAEGLSARQIAEKLGGGVTRNAVIGKAHRLNLQRGTEAPKKEPEPEPIIFEEPIFHHPSADVEPWMCRWPTDEPGKYGLHICGKTVQPGRHYCAEHCTAHYLLRRRSTAAA